MEDDSPSTQTESMMLNQDECWNAVEKHREAPFFFGVITTGVYGRPSAPPRRPLRQNVRFYETVGDAERDGLRPCRRCRPGEAVESAADQMQKICRYIEEHADEPLDLAVLASR